MPAHQHCDLFYPLGWDLIGSGSVDMQRVCTCGVSVCWSAGARWQLQCEGGGAVDVRGQRVGVVRAR